jgi:serine/threonine protein kinase
VELTEEELLQPAEIRKRLYEEEIQAALFEATLHAIVYETLEGHGFGGAVPKLYEVVAVSPTRSPPTPFDIQAILIPMEFVEGHTLYTYFETQFPESDLPKQRKANDRLLMDILIQLCMYLDILQTDLRFNHRDLKVNNVIRRNHPEGWSRILTHVSLSRPWLCMNDIVLIDFGFSCIACGETNRSSLIQAGSWFRQRDDCMKRGRDIALFLYCLQSCFPLRRRISEQLWECLRTAMCATWESTTVSLFEEGVNSRGMPSGVVGPYEFDTGIYRFMRFNTVQIPKCEPKVLLLSLDALRKN